MSGVECNYKYMWFIEYMQKCRINNLLFFLYGIIGPKEVL